MTTDGHLNLCMWRLDCFPLLSPDCDITWKDLLVAIKKKKRNPPQLSVNQSGVTREAWCVRADPLGGTRLLFTRFLSSPSQPQQYRLPWWSAKTGGTWLLRGSRWLRASVFLWPGHIHFALNVLEPPNWVGATVEEALYTQVFFCGSAAGKQPNGWLVGWFAWAVRQFKLAFYQ